MTSKHAQIGPEQEEPLLTQSALIAASAVSAFYAARESSVP